MVPDPFRNPYQRQLALWILRALELPHALKVFVTSNGYADGDVAQFLHLPPSPSPEELQDTPRRLALRREVIVTPRRRVGLMPCARENFRHLGRMFRFTTTELALLEFFAASAVEPVLCDTRRMLRRIIGTDPCRYLAAVAGLPRAAVAHALRSSGRLARSGLLERTSLSATSYDFCSVALAGELLHQRCDTARILKRFGSTPPPPRLGLDDFGHLKASLDLLVPYLRKVAARRKPGVNLLIHGPPGTGKTQLARVLGAAVNLPVFEIASEDEEGEPVRAKARLLALRGACGLYEGTPSLLVLDEAEDVFVAPSRMEAGTAGSHKGWFNQFLESNPSPVVWISNSISAMDAAFLRRFDFILEAPVPPHAQRRKIIEGIAGDTISKALVEQLAQSPDLAPAVVARATDFVRSVGGSIPRHARDGAFSVLVRNTLKSQGHPDPTRAVAAIDPDVYDISNLNAEASLQDILRHLVSVRSARLCLHGPPGTGKTSFGHWLAREIGQPLHSRKASDLISPFVGETEKNIARAFEEAAQEEAVLLLDEVDSFLRDRSLAQRSWELTQVNEMLTQIECFPGILIASTNRVEHLDSASLRRFDMKIHFGYLRPHQVVRLLESHCRKLGLPSPLPADLEAAASFETATPGDFATVARQHRFQPLADAGSLLRALERELEQKGGQHRRIGFL